MFVMSFSAGQTPDANLEQKLLAQRRLVIERPLHRQLELVDLKRLGHIIVRAHLHCLNRGFDRAVRSDQNHRRLPMMFPHMPEHVEPVIVSILMSAITTCGTMLSNCSIAFGAELKGET